MCKQSPLFCDCRIHWLHLYRKVWTLSNECPGHSIKLSDGEAPALKLWRNLKYHFIIIAPRSLLIRDGITRFDQFMSQKELFNILIVCWTGFVRIVIQEAAPDCQGTGQDITAGEASILDRLLTTTKQIQSWIKLPSQCSQSLKKKISGYDYSSGATLTHNCATGPFFKVGPETPGGHKYTSGLVGIPAKLCLKRKVLNITPPRWVRA